MIPPKATFILGVVTTILMAVSHGTVQLTNMVPADWIPYIQGWTAFFAFANSAVLTAMAAYSSNDKGPMAK